MWKLRGQYGIGLKNLWDYNMEKQRQRQLTEIYSRVVGYIRPISQFNPAKLEEFNDRKKFIINNDKICEKQS